ncbi:MAG: response regulator [Flavihumibacter sp.]
MRWKTVFARYRDNRYQHAAHERIETLEWIRLHQPATRVLILSMVESEEAVIQLLKTGAHGYLSKGAEPRALQQCLQEICDNGFAVHPYRFASLRNNAVVLTASERTFVALACSELTYREIGGS